MIAGPEVTRRVLIAHALTLMVAVLPRKAQVNSSMHPTKGVHAVDVIPGGGPRRDTKGARRFYS